MVSRLQQNNFQTLNSVAPYLTKCSISSCYGRNTCFVTLLYWGKMWPPNPKFGSLYNKIFIIMGFIISLRVLPIQVTFAWPKKFFVIIWTLLHRGFNAVVKLISTSLTHTRHI